MASNYTLDFEKPLQELDRQIEDLTRMGREREIDVEEEYQKYLEEFPLPKD